MKITSKPIKFNKIMAVKNLPLIFANGENLGTFSFDLLGQNVLKIHIPRGIWGGFDV
jgi:hypothetical protein